MSMSASEPENKHPDEGGMRCPTCDKLIPEGEGITPLLLTFCSIKCVKVWQNRQIVKLLQRFEKKDKS